MNVRVYVPAVNHALQLQTLLPVRLRDFNRSRSRRNVQPRVEGRPLAWRPRVRKRVETLAPVTYPRSTLSR